MYLKGLTINGFKSFAKKGELEFSTQITAIVGPNGSGKSNVAEAFRFVLGEQSIKSMRGKKGEDLIFGGTDGASRQNRASVSVTLDNPERNGVKVFPVDYDEITVERTVHRDGQNEYAINGSKVRLKDVQELLAAANIGPTGHHIISQGEADRILTASAKDRREMIEDALGLKVFQFKKAEAERKLKRTEDNIAQVESLRKEVQPHLKFLERQVKKIEKSLALREDLKSVYAEYLKREDTYIAHHHDRLTHARRAPEAELAELKEQLIAAKETLQNAEQDEKRDALVALEEKMSSVRTEQQAVTHQSGQVEGQISFLERRIEEKLKQDTKVNNTPIPRTQVAEIIEKVSGVATKASQSEDVHVLKRALTDVATLVSSWWAETEDKPVEVDTKAEEEELVSLRKEKTEHDKALAAVSEKETALRAEYDELKTSIESEASESREAEREVFRIVAAEREAQTTLTEIDRELQSLSRDREEFKRELQEAVVLIGSAASQYFNYEVTNGEAVVTTEEIVAEDRSVQRERQRELEKMKIRLEELGGANEDIEKEYKEVKERDEFLVREIADLHESLEKLNTLINDLTAELNEQFVSGIEKIDAEFNRFFVLMFGGGGAHLERVKPKLKKKKTEDDELLEETDPETEEEEGVVEEGIEIDVKLPNKRVRGLDMLSGGERALTSIALIFAMSQVNPPLFVILDETDAALDEANSRRYGDMIEALAEHSQLILITHNRETMGRAGILYGVTMGGDGVSKLLSVKFDEAAAHAK